ncbi:hypothetical protein ONO39_27855, partial [Salmonella enterica subsp. enterica serovar Anatum]|nr:hypothetical protein [Salmonella enterica subsp. enterica serovar Anatum]
LKNKKLAFSNEMPPLMSIERKMFHITQIGVVLLTLTLCTGLFCRRRGANARHAVAFAANDGQKNGARCAPFYIVRQIIYRCGI